MRILASYNIKGGVGKTAAAVNLAYLAAADGLRVLLWDLDPQGAASFYFRVKPKVKGGSKKLIRGDRDLAQAIRESDFAGLDLLPADFSYRHMDIELDAAKKPTRRLGKLLEPLAADYDLVLLDCPPSISLVSEAVFSAADLLLVPVVPTTLSVRTLEQLEQFRRRHNKRTAAILPFFSMVDRRKSLHRELQESLPGLWPNLLQSAIPYASDVEKMGLKRQPLLLYAGRSPAASAYRELWAEVSGYLTDGEVPDGR
jgi:cellulose biosynthesis protein BcsQ